MIKTPNIFANRLWAYFNFAIALWGLGAYKVGSTLDPQAALLWIKLGHIGVITIPIFLLHFSLYFLEQKNKNLIIYAYLLGAFFLISLFTGQMFTHEKFIFNSFYYPSEPSFLYIIFFFSWITYVTLTYRLAYKKIKITSGVHRNEIKYFFLATSIGYIGGVTDFLPTFGINLYPYGNFLVSVFPIVMTYVILKYNLMDINIIIRKSLIYSLLVSSITLIFLISVLVSERLFHHVIHYQNIATSIIMASLIALIFTPLKNRIQNLVDRAFFKATPMEMANQNEKLKAVATLASGLAHEIKNPLSTLKTFAEFVPLKKDDPVFMEQYQRIIPQEIDRIDNLVHELLLFAKPSIPQMQTTNPNEIISNVTLMLQQKFESSNIKVTMQLNANTTIQADQNQLKQALLNIILNAIDAMPNSGTLTIATTVIAIPSTNVIASEPKQSQYIITITDTGHGINPKDLPHIFEPFFTKKEKGTGLGLAITQGIIEKHSGTIKVESKINQGTNFKISMKAV